MDRKPEKSTQVFHGCCRKNADGTNRITEQGKQCLTPTSYPFWKRYQTFQLAQFALGLKNKNKKQPARENIIDI